MDNTLQSSQEFLPLDYSYDKVQEDLINVENMILLDDEKEYDNNPIFDLEQSLYEYSLVLAEFKNDLWKEFSIEDIPILQEISDKKTGNEYTVKILAIKTKQIILYIIIDNDYEEIQCYNREFVKGL
ncbi:hypothetical protein F8M41_015048 [Gigaspora margarita]|uniref:Uncharacterized protein n=1 Tax=Gigaspora margarita TaxID=4874 RepID=A0A8H4EV00_GIGMA|nr:hypothetical protein F8M41_015048 [Gigaspora margarita]